MNPEQFRQEDIVFGIKWFEKHQSRLLFLLNNKWTKRWFRYCLRIRKYDCPIDTKINLIMPNHFSYNGKKKGNGFEITTDFRTHDKYGKRLYYTFQPFWHLVHFWDMQFANQISQQLNFGFDTLTVYPAAGANSPKDGLVFRNGTALTWADVRDGAGTGGNVTNELYPFYISAGNATDTWSLLGRTVVLFDTSALGASASISESVMSLKGKGSKLDNLSITPNTDIYTCNPASNSAHDNADYGTFGSVSQTGSPITYTNWSAVAYNDYTFNSTGRGNVSKTGISKFGVRNQNYDVADIEPAYILNQTSLGDAHAADTTGTTEDPKLVVTYTIASPSNFFQLF